MAPDDRSRGSPERRGAKKLAEVVAYLFGAPRPSGARESPGRAACDLCKLKGLEAGIPRAQQSEEQICFANRAAGPGGCVTPCPIIVPRLAGLWKLFERSKYAIVTAGLDGVPIGRDMRQVQSVAEALGEPWDDTTLERFQELVDGWLDEIARKRPKK